MDDNTLTVTSSRSIALQPDQLVFSVNADFESTAGLNDVLSAVQSVSITEANLSSVSTYSQSPLGSTTQWSFVLAVPFSKQSDTLAALAALQKTIAATPKRSLDYSIQSAQVSPQLEASATCPYAALFQDAAVQARTLATGAGLMLGPVVMVSDGTSADGSPLAFAVAQTPIYANVLVYDFSSVVGVPAGGFRSLSAFLTTAPQSNSPSCTLVVQFKLIH
jgi:hypothetical protein